MNSFWSTKLLEEIMTRDRVIEALKTECRGIAPENVEFLAQAIVPMFDQEQKPKAVIQSEILAIDSSEHQPYKKRYLKVFAILLLLSRGGDIGTFVSEGTCDQDLPLHLTIELGDFKLSRSGKDQAEIHCFDICGWLPHELEFFYATQWRLTVPYFQGPRSDGTVVHYSLHSEAILPWCKIADDDQRSGLSDSVDMDGGFATVKRINIDPSSHGFAEFLENVRIRQYRTRFEG
jgi:hypothetical protein